MIFGRSPEGMSSGHSNISLEMNGTVMSMWFFFFLVDTNLGCLHQEKRMAGSSIFLSFSTQSYFQKPGEIYYFFFPLVPHISTVSGNSFQILTCLSMSLIFTIEYVFAIFCQETEKQKQKNSYRSCSPNTTLSHEESYLILKTTLQDFHHVFQFYR